SNSGLYCTAPVQTIPTIIALPAQTNDSVYIAYGLYTSINNGIGTNYNFTLIGDFVKKTQIKLTNEHGLYPIAVSPNAENLWFEDCNAETTALKSNYCYKSYIKNCKFINNNNY